MLRLIASPPKGIETVYPPMRPSSTMLDAPGTVPASQFAPRVQSPLADISQLCVGAPALAMSAEIETVAIAPKVRFCEFNIEVPLLFSLYR